MNKSATKTYGTLRLRLLSTASATALILSAAGLPSAQAAENRQPALWIDLGWHSDHVYNSTDSFALPFGALVPQSGLTAPLAAAQNLEHSYGDDGKFTFRPSGTNWVFAAAVSYGRSHGQARIDQTQALPTTAFTTFHTTIPTYPFPYHRTYVKPVQVSAKEINADIVNAESHYIIDFEAGKDVGLGLFGHEGTYTLSAGVRFAHFTNVLNVSQFHAKPDVHFSHFQYTHPTLAFFPSGVQTVPWYFSGDRQIWHALAGNPSASHNFSGIGPSIDWDATTPLWGDERHGGAISLTWDVNGALLFGKQKDKAQHRTVGANNCYGRNCNAYVTQYQNTSATRTTKNITVPNLGGAIGISYRFRDLKLNFGYRADFFFHAINTGFTGKSAITRGYQGPYASISVGLGG